MKDVLVWTKAGSVHMFAGDESQSVSWKGTRNLRLERVGDWANANGLSACVGEWIIVSLQLLYLYTARDSPHQFLHSHHHSCLTDHSLRALIR